MNRRPNFKGQAGEDAGLKVKRLCKILLTHQDEYIRADAARSLAELADVAALEALIKALKNDPYWDARWQAALALGELSDERIFQPLVEALHDPNTGVRRAAAEGLGKLGDTRAIEPLVATLWEAHITLGSISQALLYLGREAIPPLLKALEDEQRRRGAAFVLGKFKAHEAVDPLRAILLDSSTHIQARSAAATSLGEIATEAALAALEELLQSQMDSEHLISWGTEARNAAILNLSMCAAPRHFHTHRLVSLVTMFFELRIRK